MTPYLWLAVVGFLMSGIGVVGHFYTTERVVENNSVRHKNTVIYLDKATGEMRSWETTFSDDVEFWTTHKIVPVVEFKTEGTEIKP